MSKPKPALFELPYRHDSKAYFDIIHAALPMTVLLQSNTQTPDNNTSKNRFDILTAAPEYTLETNNNQIRILGEHPLATQSCHDTGNDSFATLHTHLATLLAAPIDYSHCLQINLPFCGGFIGYCSYDLAREYIRLPDVAGKDIALPDMQFSFFGWGCIQDHHNRKAWLVLHPFCNETLQQKLKALLLGSLPATPQLPPEKIADFDGVRARTLTHQSSKTQYLSDLDKIQEYIHAGDCYQINIAQRVDMETSNSPSHLYWALRHVMPSPFCALLPVINTRSAIISLSPERLLKLDENRRVLTQPIKGTIKRGATLPEDLQLAETLLNDDKNRAENIMIVDLLRNDLGKVCETGSVQVEKLCELQSFSNVHHLVSTITGTLAKNFNGVDLLKACFPGGSITGAPKIRAMQIIEELEPSRRSIYCGSLVYFSAHGTMDSNILIRTLLLHEQQDTQIRQLFCWGGGGIVADSDSETEYDESLTKIRSLLQALYSPDK